MSKGEEKIIDLLQKEGYKFEREKHFNDLKRGRLRFDFFVSRGLEAPCIIEFQGAQHYQQVKKFQPTRADFLKQQEYDRTKISYCIANEITIYCIPYWELDSIHSARELFDQRFRAMDRWKNDRDWAKFQMRKNLT